MLTHKQIDYMKEGIISDIIEYISSKTSQSVQNSLMDFVNSETYAKLEDNNTGLYAEGSGYVYYLYEQERVNGKFA